MKKSFFLSAVFSLVLFAASVQLSAQTVAGFDFDCKDPYFADKVGMMTDLLIHELVKAP